MRKTSVKPTRQEKLSPCPECGIKPPGHIIGCKTGNEKATRYQSSLERKWRSEPSHNFNPDRE